MEYFGENPAGSALITEIAVHRRLWRSGAPSNGKFRRFPPFPAAVENFGENVKLPSDVEYARAFVENPLTFFLEKKKVSKEKPECPGLSPVQICLFFLFCHTLKKKVIKEKS